jgi:hypothetical protein
MLAIFPLDILDVQANLATSKTRRIANAMIFYNKGVFDMKTLIRVVLLLALGAAMFLASSCTKDETPVTPNFEEYGIPSHVWDYNHVVWFELDYFEPAKGIANVEVWMSAKGDDPNATLRIGTQDITFDEVISYTKGKIYYGGEISLSTDQPVSYLITNGESTYEGNVAVLPKEITVATWPNFMETTNYSPTWQITPDPKFHVIDAGASNEATDLQVVRQIDGNIKTYTLLQSTWANLIPIQEFYFGINAVGYEMKNDNKVLIVGTTGNYYWWTSTKGEQHAQPARKPFRFMDQIAEDIQK